MRRALGLVLLLTVSSAQAASRSQDDNQRNGTVSVFDHPVTAEQLLRDLGPMTATLREAQTLRGNFSQKKILNGVPKPLLAEGRFLFARDRGIIWRTSKPFESELVITQKEIIQRESGGATLRRSAAASRSQLEMRSGISPSANPVAGPVSQMFFAVFALDFQALEKMFVLHSRRLGAAPGASAGGNNSFSMTKSRTKRQDVTGTPAAGSNAHWEIGLLPRPGMGDAIQRMVVSGAAQVQRVVLHDRHGDETDILLRDTAASGEPVTAAEAQRFQ